VTDPFAVTAIHLLDAPVLTVRVRQWPTSDPVLDDEHHVVGHVRERRGPHFRDVDDAVIVHVKHSTGLTVFGADRWRLRDASRNKIGAIDSRGRIIFQGDSIGEFDVDEAYASGTVTTSAGAQIGQIQRLQREGLLETYGYRWRLDCPDSLDRSLKVIAIACLGGLILAHNANQRVG
jgi:hypothetical protein